MFLGRVNIFRSALSGFRKKMIGEFREDVLSEIICKNIVKYINKNKSKNINFLDYGAGYSPILIRKIIKKLSNQYKNKIFKAYCYDELHLPLNNNQKLLLSTFSIHQYV